jgi:uncharacterized protein (DUF2141 family)
MGFSSGEENTKGTLVIKVEGIKSVDGKIGLLLFNHADGFPDQEESAILKKEVHVKGSEVEITLESLPFGNYAISLVHDVNSNKLFDKNRLGIPKEPFGFSNNTSILFGLPNFEEASVKVNQKFTKTSVKLISLF